MQAINTKNTPINPNEPNTDIPNDTPNALHVEMYLGQGLAVKLKNGRVFAEMFPRQGRQGSFELVSRDR